MQLTSEPPVYNADSLIRVILIELTALRETADNLNGEAL